LIEMMSQHATLHHKNTKKLFQMDTP